MIELFIVLLFLGGIVQLVPIMFDVIKRIINDE